MPTHIEQPHTERSRHGAAWSCFNTTVAELPNQTLQTGDPTPGNVRDASRHAQLHWVWRAWGRSAKVGRSSIAQGKATSLAQETDTCRLNMVTILFVVALSLLLLVHRVFITNPPPPITSSAQDTLTHLCHNGSACFLLSLLVPSLSVSDPHACLPACLSLLSLHHVPSFSFVFPKVSSSPVCHEGMPDRGR